MSEDVDLGAAAPESLEAMDQRSTLKQKGRKKRIATGLGLITLSVGAHFAQRYSLTNGLPDVPRATSNSLQHPVLGYFGAWIAYNGARNHRVLTAFSVATAADFAAEAGQAAITDPDHDPFEFLAKSSLLESLKDYGFAISGLALYFLQNRQKAR